MCQKYSGPLNHTAFTLLVLSSLACALCFAAPFWIFYPHAFGDSLESNPDLLSGSPSPVTTSRVACQFFSAEKAWQGLLAYCTADVQCTWFWQNSTFGYEESIPGWFKISQGLFAGSLVALIFAILLQSFYGCCCDRSCCFTAIVASFAVIGAMLAGASLCLFGLAMLKHVSFEQTSCNSYDAKLDWAFYTGIGGASGVFLSAIMFYIDGCLSRRYRHYVETSK